jgi:glycine/D-amino acid oxidase-like deaminating enzyme
VVQRHSIEIEKSGSGEITLAHSPARTKQLQAERDELQTLFGQSTTLLSVAELKDMGHHTPHFHGGLLNETGFGLHPLRYVRGLALAAHKAGAHLFSQTPLRRWQQDGDSHYLYTDDKCFKARKVLVATNGYTPEHIMPPLAGRLLPALSNILVTRPMTKNERQDQGWTSHTMAYDSRNLLHYFRLLPDGRFLFGGRGGTDSSSAAEPSYRQRLTTMFHHLFPAWAKVDIPHFWRGHVCLSYDRVPYVGPLDETHNVWTALAFHGNGVAMGTWCGTKVASLMQGKTAPETVSPVITRRLAPFPLPAFRPVYLKGAYVWYGLKDSG